MISLQRIEDIIRQESVKTSVTIDERITAAVDAALLKTHKQNTTSIRTSSGIRRMIMNRYWIKFATAVVIFAVIGLGMYALTGSLDGASITLARVRQAMQPIDWVQITDYVDGKEGAHWISFVSKVEIICNNDDTIKYYDFKTGKKFLWNPQNQDIYESIIEPERKFAGDYGEPFEWFTELFGGFFTPERGYTVSKELGTYRGREVEAWSASHIIEKDGSKCTETTIMYIDIEKELPIGVKEYEGPDGNIQLDNDIEFSYTDTGPVDIYEAGAPISAQIKIFPE